MLANEMRMNVMRRTTDAMKTVAGNLKKVYSPS
jgi:hypothetical protein